MFKTLLTLVLFSLIITGCDLKVNLNTNLNDSSIQIEPGEVNENQNTNEAVTAEGENPGQLVANEQVTFSFDLTDDNMIKQVINKADNQVWISDLKALCGAEVMIYAQPTNSMKVILTQFNPGSDLPVRSLYLLYLQNKTCKKLEVSKELGDFGARVLSPDQTKLAVALETDEAKVLKVLDLIADTERTVVTLGDTETLNGGYGAISNKFDIKWQDDKNIQYAVYEDTVKNYANNIPTEPEKVKEVRIVNLY